MFVSDRSEALLKTIGKQLDLNIYPLVHNGGIVSPNGETIVSETLGEEKSNVPQRQNRSATGSWQRPTGRQRQTYRSRAPSRTAPAVISKLRQQYEAELDAIASAYPGTQVWRQEKGMWLLSNSALINGLEGGATFLTMIPYSFQIRARGWGYWSSPVYTKWIGPRHTNFPDGSICAFQPRDGTWLPGHSIIKLLDLYTLWALRHLYLKIFTRWPGYQSVDFAFERLTEFSDDEFCGCENFNLRYKECCKKADLASDFATEAINFLMDHSFGERTPPLFVADVVKGRAVPSAIEELSV